MHYFKVARNNLINGAMIIVTDTWLIYPKKALTYQYAIYVKPEYVNPCGYALRIEYEPVMLVNERNFHNPTHQVVNQWVYAQVSKSFSLCG